MILLKNQNGTKLRFLAGLPPEQGLPSSSRAFEICKKSLYPPAISVGNINCSEVLEKRLVKYH